MKLVKLSRMSLGQLLLVDTTCITYFYYFSAHCKDIVITYDNQHARVYHALLTAEVRVHVIFYIPACMHTICSGIVAMSFAYKLLSIQVYGPAYYAMLQCSELCLKD